MSSSPDRHTFQRDAYLNRCEEQGIQPAESHLELFDKILEDNRKRVLKFKEHDLEYDLRTTDWILEKVRASDTYAQNLYAAMCNNDFMRLEIIPMLKEDKWHCSWRYAGGIIADMRGEGDYIDWYCSGITDVIPSEDGVTEIRGYVSESYVTDEIREDLLKLGWLVLPDKNNEF
jgi:hypothetical protein